MRHTDRNEKKLRYELTKIAKLYEQKESTYKEEEDSHSVIRSKYDHPSITTDSELPTKTNDDQASCNHLGSGHHSRLPDLPPVQNGNSGIKDQILSSRKEKYRLRGHLHGNLHQATDDQTRYELAKQIMDLQLEIDELNRELDQISTGKIPARFLKRELSAEAYIRIKNVKMYINRYKKKLESAETIEERQNIKAYIAKYEAELESLK